MLIHIEWRQRRAVNFQEAPTTSAIPFKASTPSPLQGADPSTGGVGET